MYKEIMKRVRMPVGMKVEGVKVVMNYTWRRSHKEREGEGEGEGEEEREGEVEDVKRKTRIGVRIIGENLPKVIRGK